MRKKTYSIFPRPNGTGTVIRSEDGVIVSSTPYDELRSLVNILGELSETKHAPANNATEAYAVLASKYVEYISN